MVKLTEVEDEHFAEKPSSSKDNALFEDDDEYTDTDSEISEASDLGDDPSLTVDETITERILALRDIIPPSTRAKIASVSSSLYSATSTSILYGGKGLWVIATSVLLLGIPYALTLGQEQEMMEEERQRGLMAESASGIIQGGNE